MDVHVRKSNKPAGIANIPRSLSVVVSYPNTLSVLNETDESSSPSTISPAGLFLYVIHRRICSSEKVIESVIDIEEEVKHYSWLFVAYTTNFNARRFSE